VDLPSRPRTMHTARRGAASHSGRLPHARLAPRTGFGTKGFEPPRPRVGLASIVHTATEVDHGQVFPQGPVTPDMPSHIADVTGPCHKTPDHSPTGTTLPSPCGPPPNGRSVAWHLLKYCDRGRLILTPRSEGASPADFRSSACAGGCVARAAEQRLAPPKRRGPPRPGRGTGRPPTGGSRRSCRC
jgi:hypothetical protein